MKPNPDSAETYATRANAHFGLQQFQQAVDDYDQAIHLNPKYLEACLNRAIALYMLFQYQAALDSCDHAISLNPDFAEAHFNRGNALHALRQYQAAVDSYDRAILLKPQFADACYNRGVALQALDQHQPALESYDRAIHLNPARPEAYQNRGIALLALLEYQAALANFEQAIFLRPDFAEAHNNRASALMALQQYQAALESYDHAARLQPDYEWLDGMRLHMRRLLCDWPHIESDSQQLEAAIRRGQKAALPFAILAISDSPSVQRQAAEIYVRDKFPPRSTEIPRRPKRDRIRIGYFSADYYDHATSQLIAELLERHDRTGFEILGFSFGPHTPDEMHHRVSTAMDRFLDVRTMPDHDIAQLARSLEVDIAVDLKGLTKESRPSIFAERAAPIQVNYLGYPGTMGASYIDYLIADHTLIPEASQQYYSEKIIYLPDSYQPNPSQRTLSAKPCTRADEGLPESAFVYCCFNSAYKITPSVFDIWMRILARVPHSVLWLLSDNPCATANLRREAALRSIAPDRLIFVRPLPSAEHFARLTLADLFLDTFPYNAHTTASDALWAGVPVLTRTGEIFASRVAASLLRAINLPELITTTPADYERLAVTLAHDPARYHSLCTRLQQTRPTAPLFDCAAFTRHLESAYTAIYDRHHAALPPDHIQIPKLPSQP